MIISRKAWPPVEKLILKRERIFNMDHEAAIESIAGEVGDLAFEHLSDKKASCPEILWRVIRQREFKGKSFLIVSWYDSWPKAQGEIRKLETKGELVSFTKYKLAESSIV